MTLALTRRRLRLPLVVAAALVSSLLTPAAGHALSCAADPDALTYRQMMRKNTTGSGHSHMFLGKVIDIKDLKPGPGGDKLAKLAVREGPVGRTPVIARVHFWVPGPGLDFPGNFVYRRHQFYVVIADRLKDGTFSDDQPCGQTWSVSRKRFWTLVKASHRIDRRS